MINQNLPEINIDIIKAKIKEEADRLKSGPALPMQREYNRAKNTIKKDMFPHRKETGIWRAIKKIQYRLQQFTFYSFVYRFAVKFKAVIPKYKK